MEDGLEIVHVHKQMTIFCSYVEVSQNRGATKSSILIGFSFINQPLWVPTF